MLDATRWLDQIRNFFPKDVVVLLQRDAIERRGMKELLFEPEIMAKVEPTLGLASAVLELKHLVPEKAKAAARDLVRRIVEELRKRLESRFAQAVRGSLDRNEHSVFRSLPNLDWPRTIRHNLKNYNETLKTIIPDELSFFRRRHRQNERNVITAMDQSGSKRFVKKMEYLLESGLRAVTLLAISDQGQPSYNADLAGKLTKLGMPCFGCTPDCLPDLLAAVRSGPDAVCRRRPAELGGSILPTPTKKRPSTRVAEGRVKS